MPDLILASLGIDTVGGERVMPLGALHLVAAARAAGFTVELRDLQGAAPGRPLVDLLDGDAPVIGLSLMADRLPDAIFALRDLRARRPDAVFVLGGAGPSEVARPLLEEFPWVDAVARGEGEETLVELLRAVAGRDAAAARRRLRGVRGLLLRDGDEVVDTGARPRLADLDGLPYPEACDVDLAPYDSVSLVTARGCPFGCAYCSVVGLWGRQVRTRSVDRVLDELAWLQARRPGSFVHFEDDTFTLDRRRVVALCEAIGRRFPGLSWGCTGRIDLVDDDLAGRMRDAGCRSMFLGVESGSDRLRAAVAKGFSSREALDRAASLRRFFTVTCHYIWGYPDETLDELLETLAHVAYLEALGVVARHARYAPFAGAPLQQGYRGRLRFVADLPAPRLFTLEPASPLVEEVARHPRVFLPFFTVDTPDEEAKVEVVARFDELHRAT